MTKVDINFSGGTLTLETGRLAQRADGSVLVKYGDTHILCTVCCSKSVDKSAGFFPLSVHYQERFYSVGRVPGGFFKREGRPSEREIIISRLIDRAVRPLFPKGFLHEVQVVCTLVSYDARFGVEVPALVGASAALLLAGLPMRSAVAAVCVGSKGGDYVCNVSHDETVQGSMDLLVAGTKDGILMVEASAQEHSEEDVLGAILKAHEWMQPLIEGVEQFASGASSSVKWEDLSGCIQECRGVIDKALGDRIAEAYLIEDKASRDRCLQELREEAKSLLPEDVMPAVAYDALSSVEASKVRQRVASKGVRIDGRDLETVRPLDTQTQVLPGAHGSAIFERGSTQVLATVTLCNAMDAQLIDTIEGAGKQRFMLHYNFPPFSVGEAGRLGSAGRREIGHGRLAWKALAPVLPEEQSFPYTIRCVSEVLSSDGSSSMATVCGVSLALMDAGVKVTAPVAGIAMGLIKEGQKIAVLTDILGDEDSLGDMDFKVAGTREGVTALQMDLKIPFVDKKILKEALACAKKARMHILDTMAKEIEQPRENMHATAPAIRVLSIPRDAIGRVVGAGGRTIKGLTTEYDVQIDIAQDGTTTISGGGAQGVRGAAKAIEEMVYEPNVGDQGVGVVKKVFGDKVLLDFKGHFGVLKGASDMQIDVGGKLNVSVQKVDKANEKIFFVLSDDQT